MIWKIIFKIEPLLSRIKKKRTTILSPCIDNIDANNMKYYGTGGRGWGIFKWALTFNWGNLLKKNFFSNIFV